MNRYSGSPARYRCEDRILFIVMPLMALVGILLMWGCVHFHWKIRRARARLRPRCLPLTLSVVCLPFAARCLFIVSSGRFYLAEEKDDVQKSIIVRSVLWGFGVTLMATTFWGARSSSLMFPRSTCTGCNLFSFLFWGRCPGGPVEVSMKNRLKVLRAERDWSQADLAQRLEVSRQSVNAIETGKFDPSLPLAFKLARLFDLRIEQTFEDGAE